MKKFTRWYAAASVVLCLLLFSGTLSAKCPKNPPQGFTDKSINFAAKRVGDIIFAPKSIPITSLVSGVLSLNNQTITITFHADLGAVPFQLTNTDTEAVIATYQTNAVAGETYVIDISELPAGNYELAYYVPGKEPQAATFEIPNM
ncbi:MAG: DUF3244 domain-containing protein [Culturomica sp.]|jgi:hypothetical protein|nr:DUF3244 domain-containing protein [Culturomica sp.]